jgi:hypothetical protein
MNASHDGPAPQPTTERYVYSVPSDRNPNVKYRVDLVANNGAGWCQCTDFATRRQPNIDAGLPILTPACTCKHLRKTLRYFVRALMPALAKHENRPATANSSQRAPSR